MRYEITAPDGSRYEITAPDDATQEQVLSYAKQQWKQQPAKPAIEDPGFAQTALIAAGRTVDRVGKGMQQLYYGATGQADKQAALKTAAQEDNAAYQQLRELRPWATGIGEAVPSMVVPMGGAATMVGNVGRMALAGGLPGALEYGSAEERAQRGIIGGLSAASLPLLGAAAKTSWSLAEPLYQRGREAIAGRTLNRAAGDAAPDVIGRLRGASELVPGSSPTAAQVAGSGGIAALERSASAANPEAYTQRAMEQASARMGALRGIAGDDAAMAAATTARDTAAKGLYDAADMGVAPIDGVFRSLSMRPQFDAAIKRAQTLAKDGGLDDIFFRDKNGKPIALIGQGAHYIKKALDEAGEYGSSSYTGKTGAANANRTNDAFQQWLEKSIPEYAAAKTAFAQGSVPINRMEVGQALLNKAQPALADYGALSRETGATFAKALRDGDAVAARATGYPGARMDKVMAPDQMATLESIAQDLGRKANAQDLGRGVGSDTFQKLSMSNIAQQSGMPRTVGGLLDLPGVSRATAWAYRDTDQKMQALLADALLDPKKAAELMARADKKWLSDNPKIRRLLEQSAVRGAGLLGMSATESMAEPSQGLLGP
jgi:hypothetical protein